MTTQSKEVAKAWPKVSEVLSLPKNGREFEKLARILDEIIDETGGDEKLRWLPWRRRSGY